jgi:hypothetical protein
MAMAEQRAVTKRLARQLDQELTVFLSEEGQLLVKAARVEHEPVLDQKLDGVLGARAPTIAAASRALLDHGDGFLPHLIFLIARQVARDLVIVAVSFDHSGRGWPARPPGSAPRLPRR